ncbi:V-type proton ATPase subunit G-like [Lingula anatina]|uniref:V-type proton ATPase subunit G n=1 Tax=Lingula anatina TaxID=7574 RepID=A0A1S3KBD0_LINAN|nr:V-type proton ATPase subunit G-like [Lingula anatina]XP_013419951.1 V-type proton ATPase subunit G-like [Lingula anatina]|eukprot:XP_013419940.1 V-type proton ATPase subunit G-like [Lingula anatina]
MKMASQSTGIQQLLVAEKRAAEKVAEARKRKAKRLKQAKEEAQAEVDAYRQEREKQYKEYEAKVLGSKGDTEAKIDQNTRLKIEEINRNVQKQREQCLQRLLSLVYDIKPEMHHNMKIL